MKNLFIAALALAFFTTSCSKEKKALKNIEGQWTVTELKKDSAGVITDELAAVEAFGITGLSYEFVSCESGVTCNAYMSASGSFMGMPINEIDTLTYSISSDAKTLVLDSANLTIDKLTSSVLECSEVDGDITGTIKMERQ